MENMKIKTDRYSVLIIGAGRIGATFDSPDSRDILTHAHAFKVHVGFDLIGFVDEDHDAAQKAAEIWGASAFSSISEAFKNNKIDVVSICVPDELHCGVVSEVLNYPIGLIFVEKPLSKTLKEAERIIQLSKERNIPVIVNYSRRFVSEFNVLKHDIAKNKYGRFIAGNGFYGKGILHNGTHMIDLLRYLLGEISESTEISRCYDFYNDDPTVSAIFKFSNKGMFSLHGVDCTNYTIFEMELMFEKARIRLIDSGFKIEQYLIKESERFAGYKNLYLEQTESTDLNKAMFNAAGHIYNVLHNGDTAVCSAVDAYKAMQIAIQFNSDISHV